MTDNEIKKALQIHIYRGDCKECAYAKFPVGTCEKEMHKDALDLINRQKAEVESLKIANEKLYDVNKHQEAEIIEQSSLILSLSSIKTSVINSARAESVKEVVERLHKHISDFREKREMVMLPYTEAALLCIEKHIDNLVKEFTEETK